MKRPIGVILTCIVLGVCALFQLLTAMITAGGAFAIGHAGRVTNVTPLPNPPSAVVPPSTGFLVGVIAVMVVFYLALAAWAIVTIVGLIRLRNWGRYSVLAIGGCLAGFGSIAFLITVVLAFAMPSFPGMPPTMPPHLMQGVFLAEGVFFAGFVAIGIWWLVYYNRRAVKAVFVPARPSWYSSGVPAGYPTPYAIDPNIFPTLPTPQAMHVEPPPGPFSEVPIAVMVIAGLFLFSALCCLPATFLPLPGFFFGIILTGFWVHGVYLAMTAVMALIGIGLLRLDNRARLGTYGMMLFGCVNFGVMFTPWGRTQYAAYNALILGRMNTPVNPFAPDLYQHLIWYFVVPFCALVYGAQVWILQYYRESFLPKIE